nr:helix-turn-helix transcriptional regulator [Mycobacterium bourgelatii]
MYCVGCEADAGYHEPTRGGARLFISPRTVQSHLTHVSAKLGLDSRVQLVQEAGRHV